MFDQNWLRRFSTRLTRVLLDEMSKADGLMDRPQAELEAGMASLIERAFRLAFRG